MNTEIVMLTGALLVAGIFTAAVGLLRIHVPTERATTSDEGRITRALGGLRHLKRATWIRIAFGLVAGLVAWALTGWLIFVAVGPAAVVGLPWLLGAPPNRELELLLALERWSRGLASSMPTGKSISDAIRATRRQTPAVLTEPVTVAVMRMDARWSTADALLAMADDLKSPHADACLAALALASERGGTGATATLHSLADSMQARLRALREIEAERAKPRVVVRQITVITMVMIAAALLFGGSFFEPYASPVGQLILAGLLVAYVASLVMLRQRTVARPRARILVSEVSS